MRQGDCWRAHGEFAFEACPRGNGIDTFRRWEALLLGTLPIVRTSTLDPLYAQFPVVIIEDWREVTPSRLAEWRAQFTPQLDDVVERLCNDWWLEHIRSASRRVRDLPRAESY